MPNTLIHIAVQAPASRLVFRDIPVPLILLGCVVPDLPWILRRAVLFVFPSTDPVWVVQYATVQSTLLFCLVFCAAVATLSHRYFLVWIALGTNCLLHLLLDAIEIKPGNGVHLLAPFQWEHFTLALIWPESPLITVLTIAGIPVGLAILGSRPTDPEFGNDRRSLRAACLFVFLTAYMVLPAAFVRGPLDADIMSMRTLAETSDRPGRTVNFDRRPYLKTEQADYIVAFTGEKIRLVGATLPESGWASATGEFIDEHVIEVRELHQSDAGLRDFASYAGLSIILLVWLRVAWRLRAPGDKNRRAQ